MGIVTKTGDDGKSRFGNKVEDKDGLLLEAEGTIDELLSVLGIVMMRNNNELGDRVEKINRELYLIMAKLSGFDLRKIDLPERINFMEKEIEKLEKEKGSVSEFLKAGKQLDVWFNWARTVARRAERRIVGLSKHQEVDKNVLKYFNRLSDYLFMLARLG